MKNLMIKTAFVVGGMFFFFSSAQADTSAGIVISNSVEVQYSDAGGNVSCTPGSTCPTDTVDVTVALVPSVAFTNLSVTTETGGSGDELTADITINLDNNSNGSVVLDVAQTDTSATDAASLTNVTYVTTADEGTVNNSTLDTRLAGATLASTTVTGTGPYTISLQNITDPADFAAGDTVLINNVEYVVQAQPTPDGDDSTPDSLVLTAAADPTADVTAAGVGGVVGERITITIAATGSNIGEVSTLDGSTTSYFIEFSATNSGYTIVDAANGLVVEELSAVNVTVLAPLLEVAKYVRNASGGNRETEGNSGGTNGTSIAGATYYDGGVTGGPTDTLEYLIVVTNQGSGDAGSVVVEDTLPSYTTIVDDAVFVDTTGCDGTFDVQAGSTQGDTYGAEAGTGIVVVSGGVLTVYAGTGGSDESGAEQGGVVAGYGAGGTAPGDRTCVRYQVTID